jgi:hypothetical protein
MDADDWHAAGKGFFEMKECRMIADIFLHEGEEALNGMSFTILGPIFSVATVLDAPDVEILEGKPFQ